MQLLDIQKKALKTMNKGIKKPMMMFLHFLPMLHLLRHHNIPLFTNSVFAFTFEPTKKASNFTPKRCSPIGLIRKKVTSPCGISVSSSTVRMMMLNNQGRGSRNANAYVNAITQKRKRRKKKGPKGQKNQRGQRVPTKSSSVSASASPKHKIKFYTDEEITQMSIGQAIQESTSIQQLLITASRMWIPTDKDLPHHLIHQSIHHEKRFRSSCLLLSKLSDYVGTGITPTNSKTLKINSMWAENDDFKRVILAATLPFQSENVKSDTNCINIEKECRFVTIALVALYTIAGHTLPSLAALSPSKECQTIIDDDIHTSIQTLIQRADTLANRDFTLNQAIEARWAIHGLYKRIPNLDNHSNPQNIMMMPNTPNLDHRVRQLPFDIIPQCIDWGILQTQYHKQEQQQSNNDTKNVIKTLLKEIPFSLDTITTRSGSLVQERRSTAWVAEDGIGALAYSGKLMNPHPIPPFVRYTMRAVETSIIQHDDISLQKYKGEYKNKYEHDLDYRTQLKLCVQETGGYFDCALTNHYPNFDSACKFHTDPEHGSFWERLTCVVSVGDDDIRKFAFRPIPQVNDWSQWEDDTVLKHLKGQLGIEYRGDDGIGIEPVMIHLFPGDCVKMWGSCNDVFHHAVYGADGVGDHSGMDNDGRVSLVFKRAVDRGNGRKGHGQRGEGRRSRRL